MSLKRKFVLLWAESFVEDSRRTLSEALSGSLWHEIIKVNTHIIYEKKDA